LPDITITDSDGSTFTQPAVTNVMCTPSTTPDTDIEVNGVAEGSVVAGSTVDIQLSDSLGVVTPTSVTQVGNDFAVVLPDAPPAIPRSTATLMKTGQTTVYRTGDDADTSSEGRPTDFLTLDAAPLHNDGTATLNTTTSRFTDELGGQTYTNDIVLDWSTWNGSTLLGWYRVADTTVMNWDSSIDAGLALSVSTFTSGWKLPNLNEIISINDNSIFDRVNYAPFNIGGLLMFTSTTRGNSTGFAWACGTASSNGYSQFSKTNTRSKTIYCRTFSLSTSNVLS
jgi:hypothetical protein